MSKQDPHKDQTIRQLYTELNKLGNAGEWEKAIKTANRILGLDVTETKAMHCKVVCLIQVNKFEEALKYIEKNNLKDLVFEKGYSQYRNNLLDAALKTVNEVTVNPLPPNLKELKAQILYRLERYEECFDLYKDIIKNTSDDYDDERKTNLSAVAAQLVIEGTTRDLPEFEENTYELAYNKGCALAGEENYAEAEKKLRASEKMCRETFDDEGMTEAEIANELAIIRVQLAYCLQMQGKTKDAAALYVDALKNKPSDAAVVAVASNNSAVLNKDQNMFDSKKKIKMAMSEACEHKLTSRQKKIIAFNNTLLSLLANQSDCQSLATRLAATYPDLAFQCALVRAAQYAKDKKYRDAIEILDKISKTNAKVSLEAKFAIVQLHLMSGNKKGAIEVLQNLGETTYSPGVVSTLVALHMDNNDKQRASDVLKEAVDYYKKSKISGANLSDMYRQAAAFHLRDGQAETAAKSLEELSKVFPNDVKILAELVIAYSKFDTKKAMEISKRLPKLDELTSPSEIDALEATNWTMIAKAVKKTATKAEQSPGGTNENARINKKKSKKKRKPKLPKNYDPNVQPDPERWLPKYERTGYKKKRDRRVKEVIKGSQGTASGQSDQYDMSKSYNQSKASPATPQIQESAPGPRQQQRKHQHKKKKGRH